MTNKIILKNIREELKKLADIKTKDNEKRFFKEPIKLYGINIYKVSTLAKKYFVELNKFEKQRVWQLCDELWKSGYIEETFIACHWSFILKERYEEIDFLVFTNWLNNYVNNWASCDSFCNHTIGEFLQKFPKYITELKKWTKSDNRWVRRASAVSLIIPAKKGLFINEVFIICNNLLIDKDDLVQKGYGWLLKVASQSHQDKVFQYTIKNKAIMPRTALRYAIEKMPLEMKQAAMMK